MAWHGMLNLAAYN